VGRGLAAHPIGVVVLGRLAVDQSQQDKGLGTTLLQDALLRAANAAETVGASDRQRRALLLSPLRLQPVAG
jgi:predicted N-acetyltransferase YhbS